MNLISEEKRDLGIKVLQNQADSKLVSHLNSCVHCGLCAESCMYFIATKDEKFIPARKVDLVSSVYKRYCTTSGKIVPKFFNARDLDEETVSEMVDLLYGACTMCGRCVAHCSIGVDIPYLVRTGRVMLANMGFVPETLQATVNAAVQTGNNMGIPTQEFVDTLKWLEDDLRDEVKDPSTYIPLDESHKDIFYTLNPREPKFFPLSISAMAKIFYAAKESWTISTKMYDVTNYGYFSGNNDETTLIAQRLFDEMHNLDAKVCVLAECGHGSRAFRWEAPNYLNQHFPFDVVTSVELIANYIKEGRIKLDREKLKKRVTLHDPCNLVRNGGIIKEQRYILQNCVSDFVEMNPHGVENYCCGGGGGQLAMSEYNDRRMKISEIKANQIKSTGAQVVVTPCHNCVDQLNQINFWYKLNVQVKTIAEIVADALIIG